MDALARHITPLSPLEIAKSDLPLILLAVRRQ